MFQKLLTTYRTGAPRELTRRILLRAGQGLVRASTNLERHPSSELSPVERQLLAKNAVFRNCHAGKRCFVIGNGPSLAQQDLTPLANEITFAASGFWKHPIVERWQPTYYCFADPLFFDGSESSLNFFRQLRTRIHETTFILPSSAARMVQNHQLVSDECAYYVAFGDSLSRGGLGTITLTEKIPAVINVVQLAMLAALYMGCSPIYLLGLDHDWLAHRGPDRHFYSGGILEKHPQVVSKLEEYSYKYLMECQLELWRGYESLQEFARQQGLKIFNATAGGFLDVFPRTEFEVNRIV